MDQAHAESVAEQEGEPSSSHRPACRYQQKRREPAACPEGTSPRKAMSALLAHGDVARLFVDIEPRVGASLFCGLPPSSWLCAGRPQLSAIHDP